MASWRRHRTRPWRVGVVCGLDPASWHSGQPVALLESSRPRALAVAEEATVEREAEREAERLLLPSARRVGHASAWHHADRDRAADDLWVDPQLLHTRMSTSTPHERVWMEWQWGTVWLWCLVPR